MRILALLTLLVYGSRGRGSPLLQPLVVTVALNETAQFSCISPAGVTRWYIYDSGSTAPFVWPYDANALQSFGIRVNSSELLVKGLSANNETRLMCIDGSGAGSETAVLQIYAKPSAPANLRQAAIGNRRLTLTWNAPFVPYGVNVFYNVLVTLGAKEVFRSNRTCNVTYEYVHTLGSECQNYQISVVAENGAGVSDPSVPLVTTIPTVPQFTSAMLPRATLILGNGYLLRSSIAIEAPLTCPVYSVDYYYFQFQNVISHSFNMSVGPLYPSNNSSEVKIVVNTSDGLQPNMKYVYTIIAVNMVGNSTSAPQSLYTTDVQSSTITGSDHQLNVTCFFAEGTQARGCAVCLEKSGEVVYQMVPRVNETAEGVIRTEFSVDCYNISVVDWEEDGSTGSLGVPVSGVWGNEVCTTAGPRAAMAAAGGVPLLVAMVVALLSSVIGLVLLTLAGLGVYVYIRRRAVWKKASFKRDSHSPHSVTSEDPGHNMKESSPPSHAATPYPNCPQVLTTPTHSTTSSTEVTPDASSLLHAQFSNSQQPSIQPGAISQ